MGRFAMMMLCTALVLLSGFSHFGICREEGEIRMNLGGVRDCGHPRNSAEIENLARFAVQEHNKRENALLEFARVLKAKEQVVAGKLYHLTLEVIEVGKKKTYEAKVWVKPWMNFKQLQEFKHVENGPSFTPSDLGVAPDGNEFGWKTLPTNAPEVKDAADHAVKSIQMKSNSLYPYKLLEIVLAKAKVVEDYAKFKLLLKLRRGNKFEKLMVEVRKNRDGNFY